MTWSPRLNAAAFASLTQTVDEKEPLLSTAIAGQELERERRKKNDFCGENFVLDHSGGQLVALVFSGIFSRTIARDTESIHKGRPIGCSESIRFEQSKKSFS